MKQGKSNKQKEDSARLYLIGVIGVLFTLLFTVITKDCEGKKPRELGYLVYTSTTETDKVRRVKELETVYNVVNLRFPDVVVNLEAELNRSRYFQIITERNEVYIEKVWLIKRRYGHRKGKYRSKKIKNHELKLI